MRDSFFGVFVVLILFFFTLKHLDAASSFSFNLASFDRQLLQSLGHEGFQIRNAAREQVANLLIEDFNKHYAQKLNCQTAEFVQIDTLAKGLILKIPDIDRILENAKKLLVDLASNLPVTDLRETKLSLHLIFKTVRKEISNRAKNPITMFIVNGICVVRLKTKYMIKTFAASKNIQYDKAYENYLKQKRLYLSFLNFYRHKKTDALEFVQSFDFRNPPFTTKPVALILEEVLRGDSKYLFVKTMGVVDEDNEYWNVKLQQP